MAAGADHSCLPRELAELVTGHLSPSALNSLFRASRTFGLQPTDHLVTRLYLDVAQIDLRRPHQPRRFDRLANVKTLQLLSSAEDPVADTTCSQLSSTVLFLTLHAPSMRHLTHLRLTNLPLSFVVAAAACLGAVAPAALASIHLDLTTDDSEAPAFGLSQLWPSLARVASLRSLRVGAMHTQLFSGDLDGLGRVCQLQSLQIDNAIMSVSSLPFMQGLTQLRLAGIVALGSAFQGLPACLTLSLLDIELWNFDGDDNLEAVTDCIDWSTLTGLTNLKLSLNSFDPHDLPPLPPAVLLNTALVCLTAHSAALTCAHLLHLPCLTELHCYSLELPAAGAGVRVTHLLSLDMVHCFQGLSNWGEEHTPVQAVAFTFPQLLSLSLNPSEEYGCAPASQMWPPGSVGCMSSLCSLNCMQWAAAAAGRAGSRHCGSGQPVHGRG